jgi:hypothetical protein
VAWVTIIPAKGCDGRTELAERTEAWRAGLPDELADAYLAEAEVTMDLAGYAAGEVFLGIGEAMPPAGSVDHDNAHISALCTWDGADGLLLQPRDYLARVREVLERPDLRLAILRLACALLRCGTLTGAYVEEIATACGVTSERSEQPIGWDDRDEDAEGEAFSWSRW